MPDFLGILVIYYLCDATAVVRPMTFDEVGACTAAYEQIKTYFPAEWELAPRGTPERHAQMQAAYLAFLGWEAENADLVVALQAGASAAARGEVPGGG